MPTGRLAPAAPAGANEALANTVMVEVRTAIRGRTLADLAASGVGEAPALEAALTLLIARGQVVRRGNKFFVA